VWPEEFKPHPYILIVCGVFGVICLIVPLIHTAWVWIESRWNFSTPESPLEIIFDAQNPASRHWSVEQVRDENGNPNSPFWEHRVAIKNNSMKTLKNVSVTIERIGQMPERPYDTVFDKVKQPKCDIKPGCWELVPVMRWPFNKSQVGMLAGSSALAYGPVRVTASADDTAPSVREFQFDYQTEQMLFDDVGGDPKHKSTGLLIKCGVGVFALLLITGTTFLVLHKTHADKQTNITVPPQTVPAPETPSEPKPLNKHVTIAERVAAIICGQLQVDENDIKPDDDFEMNLGATPENVYILMRSLEDQYHITIPDKDAEKIKTVQNAIDYIVRRECSGQQINDECPQIKSK
jgi:acyl carrier protein